jgi:hypothetical protein
MDDDSLLTLVFWVVAIVGFVVFYLIPIAILVIGIVLWRKVPESKTGLVLSVIGAVLCSSVVIWRISEFIALNS